MIMACREPFDGLICLTSLANAFVWDGGPKRKPLTAVTGQYYLSSILFLDLF